MPSSKPLPRFFLITLRTASSAARRSGVWLSRYSSTVAKVGLLATFNLHAGPGIRRDRCAGGAIPRAPGPALVSEHAVADVRDQATTSGPSLQTASVPSVATSTASPACVVAGPARPT